MSVRIQLDKRYMESWDYKLIAWLAAKWPKLLTFVVFLGLAYKLGEWAR